MLNTARASPNAGMGGPVRGLSVRRGGSPPAGNKPLPGAGGPPPPAKGTLSILFRNQASNICLSRKRQQRRRAQPESSYGDI
jgi:hypothetical protein